MYGTAEEVGHPVLAVGSSMVVGPPYVVTVGLKPSAVAGAERERVVLKDRDSSCSAGSTGGEAAEDFVRWLIPDCLLNNPGS